MSSDASRMFEALFAGVDGYIELRPIRRREGALTQEWFSTGQYAEAARRAVELGDRADVYVGVAPRSRRQGTKDAVGEIRVLWADVDGGDDALLELIGFPVQPSIVVGSGSPGGHHAYWLLQERIGVVEAERLNRALAERIGADARATDASRVLRVPGTLNHKHHRPPTSGSWTSRELATGSRRSGQP